MNKADVFMGNYGNLIGSVGTGIASFINANKKQDPTGRPYKTGTNMIKSKKSKLIKYQTLFRFKRRIRKIIKKICHRNYYKWMRSY